MTARRLLGFLIASTCAALIVAAGGCSGSSDADDTVPPDGPDASADAEAGKPADAKHEEPPADQVSDPPPDTADAGDSAETESGGDAFESGADTIDAPPDGPVYCSAGDLAVFADGIGFSSACGTSLLRLLPRVQLQDGWHGAGADGSCTQKADGITCPAGAAGNVEAKLAGSTITAVFTAAQDTVVRAVSLEGQAVVPGATGWLSNGFQSWSQSGVIALADPPTETELQNALGLLGEDEVYRRGPELSWWYSFVGGGDSSLVIAATTANRFRSFVQAHRTQVPGVLRVRAVSGGLEQVAAKTGAAVSSESFRLELGEDLEGMLRRYGESLVSRRQQVQRPAPSGWNSWYCFWDDVEQADIVDSPAFRSPDFLQAALEPHLPAGAGPMRAVVDDGWQKAWGDWTANSKFPAGMDGVVAKLSAKGLRAGIWLAPLLVHPNSETAKQHPSWLVQGAVYEHPTHGKLNILDVTDPEAAQHLSHVIATIRGWGFDLLKIDFLFAGAQEGGRDAPVTGMEAYHEALQIIRAAAGEDALLFSVGAPPVPTLPYVDGWRSGGDIAFKPLPIIDFPKPTWSFIANQAREFTSRWPFCLATLCDADPMILRAPLTEDEVSAGAWVAVSTGGAVFLSDDLTSLDQARWPLGLDAQRVGIGLGGVPATPESFFPDTLPDELENMKDPFNLFYATHHVPKVWRMPDGTRVGFNWTDSTMTIEGVSVPKHAAQVLP